MLLCTESETFRNARVLQLLEHKTREVDEFGMGNCSVGGGNSIRQELVNNKKPGCIAVEPITNGLLDKLVL